MYPNGYASDRSDIRTGGGPADPGGGVTRAIRRSPRFRRLSTAFAAYIRTPACTAGTPRADNTARATVSDFVDHIDYAVKLIGIDHVGISSDFDGGGGVVGWNDASETFNVTLELVRRGYTEPQIAQLWSGNLLRVMEAVERGATAR